MPITKRITFVCKAVQRAAIDQNLTLLPTIRKLHAQPPSLAALMKKQFSDVTTCNACSAGFIGSIVVRPPPQNSVEVTAHFALFDAIRFG